MIFLQYCTFPEKTIPDSFVNSFEMHIFALVWIDGCTNFNLNIQNLLITHFLFYTHFIAIVMPPGPVSCIGALISAPYTRIQKYNTIQYNTMWAFKYPHCIVLYCIFEFEVLIYKFHCITESYWIGTKVW